MSVLSIDLGCQCDACSSTFNVRVQREAFDEAKLEKPEAYVEELVRSGFSNSFRYKVRGKQTIDREFIAPTVQGGLLLCERCSKLIDDKFEEEPTEAQILEALRSTVQGDILGDDDDDDPDY